MFGLCNQSLYYLLLTVIAEVSAILIMGFDNWIDYFKNNYVMSIIGTVIYLAIIQTLCFFDKSLMAWILFWLTFVINIVSILAAVGRKYEESKSSSSSSPDKEKTSFDKSANQSCKSSCRDTCGKNTHRPHDFDCNSYCDNTCNHIF